LFWTIPISSSSVQANFGHGTASYHISNLAVKDYGQLANAIFGGSSVPATVSFALAWNMIPVAGKQRTKVRNVAQGFAGDFWEVDGDAAAGAATLAWSAQEQQTAFSFISDPANTSTSYYADLGHERNGAFFPQGEAAKVRTRASYVRIPEAHLTR
jgi:hypothetical protein